jgi:hypothetical protein
MSSVKPFRILTLAAACAFAGALSPMASAQTTPDDAVEATPVVATPPTQGPIVLNASFRNGAGHANVTMNPDGSYLFSGSYSGHKAGKDIDVAMALKASSGGIILFHFVGDAANGAQWSKTGTNDAIRDFWSTFSSGDKASVSDRFYESAAGKRAEYEAREKKREELQKAEDEARKRHDEKVAAEKKAELEKQRQEQAAQEQAQQSSSSGGGSSIGSVIGTIGGVLGSVLSFL